MIPVLWFWLILGAHLTRVAVLWGQHGVWSAWCRKEAAEEALADPQGPRCGAWAGECTLCGLSCETGRIHLPGLLPDNCDSAGPVKGRQLAQLGEWALVPPPLDLCCFPLIVRILSFQLVSPLVMLYVFFCKLVSMCCF